MAAVSLLALSLVAGGFTAWTLGRQTIGREAAPPPAGVSPWPADADAVVWAVGSTIHADGYSIDVGRLVGPFVRTANGFAFLDANPPQPSDVTLPRAVTVYSVTDAGVAAIGEAAADTLAGQGWLRSDPNGTLVGWIGRDFDVQIYDMATATLRSFPVGADWANKVELNAIDGRTAYGASLNQSPGWQGWALTLDTGEFRTLTSTQGPVVDVYSARNGVLAYGILAADGAPLSLRVGRSTDEGLGVVDFTARTFQSPTANLGHVSPSGEWFTIGVQTVDDTGRATGSRADFVDTRTAERRTFDLPDGTDALPVAWLDELTVQVLGIVVYADGIHGSLALYRCTVPDGTCQRAVDLGEPRPGVWPYMPTGLLPW